MAPLISFLLAYSLGLALPLAAAHPPPASVVINEIHYHPPDDRDELQWIELHNASLEPVSLAGWSFSRGIRFRFTNEVSLPPGAFLVVARDRGAFVTRYGQDLPVVGNFSGRLKHSGETLELSNAHGQPIDVVQYADRDPWPLSPDGASPSLERIVPRESGRNPANWAPSPLPPFQQSAGTPGRTNAAHRPNLPPLIWNVRCPPPVPDQPTRLEVDIADSDGIDSAVLEWETHSIAPPDSSSMGSPSTGSQAVIALERTRGDLHQGTYTATLPGVPAGNLLRFRLRATDRTQVTRLHPHPDDLRPTYSAYIGPNLNDAQIPFVFVTELGPRETPSPSSLHHFNPNHRIRPPRHAPEPPARGQVVITFHPPKGQPVQLFDHVRLTPRHGGWKLRLHKDQPLEAMTTVNVLFEFQPRFALAEHLAYELYRAAEVPAPLSGHWRLWVNGQPQGYHLYVEQPNSSFLRRIDRDPDGDLFKLLWYGRDFIGQHEKKNNPQSGHVALVALKDALESSDGDALWQVIQHHLNVPEFVSYYAASFCLQNWDGFFNNHYLYRAPDPHGRWEIYPWDQDKTWGDYDGASHRHDWYTMPLSFGSAGDQPRPSLLQRFSSGPFGGLPWWRPPGHFSGPLLAHPHMRHLLHQRIQTLCHTVFTPEQWEVPITRLERRLEPEILFRAQIHGENVEAALSQFHQHLESFRRQVVQRRAYLLKKVDTRPPEG